MNPVVQLLVLNNLDLNEIAIPRSAGSPSTFAAAADYC